MCGLQPTTLGTGVSWFFVEQLALDRAVALTAQWPRPGARPTGQHATNLINFVTSL